MKRPFTIVVADRNRHVRSFLQRELEAEGYRVLLAENGREVIALADSNRTLDLLILDPEVPFVDWLEILDQLSARNPSLPVIIHTFLTDLVNHPRARSAAAFLEKLWNTDRLQQTVSEVLQKHYPGRHRHQRENGTSPIDARQDCR